VPIRQGGRPGNEPAPGWSSANDWTGSFVPFAELPTVLNPRDGVIVAADQALTGPSYRYRLAASWGRGYRASRIRQLLTDEIGRDKVSPDDMARIQRDTRNPMAPVLVPHLLAILLPSRYDADGQRLLADWDFTQSAGSAAAAYYNVVWRNLLRLTFHDQMRQSVWPDGGQRWYAIVSRLLEEPTSPWWDDVTTDGVVENRDTILAAAMRAARDELTRTLARDPGRWRWGALHGLELRSRALGDHDLGLVRALFNRGPFAVGGGPGSVDATRWDAREGYAVTSAPSARLVMDLGSLDRSRWVNLTGASGHPFTAHYRDQLDVWRDRRSLAWPFTGDAVRRASEQVLRLVP
jgi:penicillin amidase